MPHPGQLHLVVPTCVIVRDGQVLILKRGAHEIAYPGKWTIPGGKVDRAEYESTPKHNRDAWGSILETTLRREIAEEAGIEIDEPHYIGSYAFIRPDGYAVIGINYWATWKSGEVAISNDFDAVAWIDPARVGEYEMVEGLDTLIARVPQLVGVPT
ncbi:NUDIX domain-containing protein [Candidatus Berkelbacteria bacterium]|nr:NUDIX domain-containing protein [Candidatus Berkelbacteria bacterium]